MAARKVMMVAGFGINVCATAEDLDGALAAALAAAGCQPAAITRVAVPAAKGTDPRLAVLARRLGCMAEPIPLDMMRLAAGGCATGSERTLALYGVGSVAEAVALALAGREARLIAPRHVVGGATCAIAVGAP
jgi:cobalt-precorrin 5A hydrolase